MNIIKESVGNNASKIRIEFTREDFQPAVDKKLKEYRRKATVPGFRVGMAPMEIVKKMVGSNILMDEVNNFVSTSLENYIKENELELLGYPLSSEDNKPMDLENDSNFVMNFDIAEMPKFETKLGDVAVEYYTVEADEDSLDKNTIHLRERFGKEIELNAIESNENKVKCSLMRVDELGVKVEGGFEREDAPLDLKLISDEYFNKNILNLKVGDSFVANPINILTDKKNIGALLGNPKAEEGDYKFEIKGISRIELAELDTTFFNEVMPDKGIETVEAFRKELAEHSTMYFKPDADKLFHDSAMEGLMEKTEIELPFEFLKRWVETNSNGEVKAEDIEAEKENYIKGFKSDILKSRIVSENNLAPTMEETMDYIRRSIAQNFYGLVALEELDDEAKSLIDRVASQIVNNEKEVRRFYDSIANEKLVNFLKSNMNVTEKRIKSNEFSDIIMNKINK